MRAARTMNRLTARQVARAAPGIHEDGGGLRLNVEASGARRWTLRLTVRGKRRHKGLGSFPLVSLQEARDKAREYRKAASEGRDLAAERRSGRSNVATFRHAFEAFFELKRRSLINPKHIAQWHSTMATYVMPSIGDRPVADITASEIIALMKPIWFSKPETAARVLQRVEATFKSAILNELRERASPTIGVADHLGPHERNVGCHAAMHYTAVPEFLIRLRGAAKSSTARLALEFLILTACRSQEVRGASWAEINLDQAVWSIPAARMKTRRRRRHPHVVPLSPRCMEILVESRALNPKGDLIFPGAKQGKPLSENTFVKIMRDMGVAKATAHGFRSAFKDWCAEVLCVRDEVSEAALSHGVSGKVRAAYLRTDFLSERVGLMREWGFWLRSDPPPLADIRIHNSRTGITM